MGSFPETYHNPFNSSNLSTSCQQGKKKTNEGSVVVYVVASSRTRLNQALYRRFRASAKQASPVGSVIHLLF